MAGTSRCARWSSSRPATTNSTGPPASAKEKPRASKGAIAASAASTARSAVALAESSSVTITAPARPSGETICETQSGSASARGTSSARSGAGTPSGASWRARGRSKSSETSRGLGGRAVHAPHARHGRELRRERVRHRERRRVEDAPARRRVPASEGHREGHAAAEARRDRVELAHHRMAGAEERAVAAVGADAERAGTEARRRARTPAPPAPRGDAGPTRRAGAWRARA